MEIIVNGLKEGKTGGMGAERLFLLSDCEKIYMSAICSHFN
jgi:hypothetical protein